MKNIFKVFILFALIITTCTIAEAKIGRCPYKIIQDPKGVYIVEINTAKSKYKLLPYVTQELETNNNVFNSTGARLVVNAGFFDPKNQKTVSYVTINNETTANPEDNENLMSNQVLKGYLDKILNRSEFRILEDEKGKILYDIAQHKDPVKEGYKIKHSIQAGPMLFPDLKLEEEFFILVKDGKVISESASALHKYARTAIGIRENKVYLFIATNEAPMTLEEVADLTRKWGMENYHRIV